MIDYHIHTPLCNHAQGSMTAMAEQAIHLGFHEICFLDHLIVDGPGMKHSMDVDEVPLYMQAAAHLRKQFKGRIIIRCGLEVDFIPGKLELIRHTLDRFDFDVIAASVHFVGDYNVASRRSMPRLSPEDTNRVVLNYFETLDRLLDHDFFDLICHPDVVKKTGMPIDGIPEALIDGLLDRIAEKNLTLEFNTGGWAHPAGDSYPSTDFARKCHERDIPFTLGSDTHRPENLGAGILKASRILKGIGYSTVNTFDRRLVRPVPL